MAQDSVESDEPLQGGADIVAWPAESSSAEEGPLESGDPPQVADPSLPRFSLALELAFSSGNVDEPATTSGGLDLLTVELSGSYEITEEILATVVWAGLYGSAKNGSAERNERFLSGNALLQATYALDVDYDGLEVRVGGGLALPFARIPSGDRVDAATAAVSYLGGLRMRGSWNAWLYSPEQLVLVVPGRAELSVDAFLFGFDFTPALYVPTTDRDDDIDLVLQTGADAAVRWKVLDVGLALHVVWGITSEGNNHQFSTEPFVRIRTERAFAQARLTLNLDPPAGPISFDSDKHHFWGVHAGGGVRF